MYFLLRSKGEKKQTGDRKHTTCLRERSGWVSLPTDEASGQWQLSRVGLVVSQTEGGGRGHKRLWWCVHRGVYLRGRDARELFGGSCTWTLGVSLRHGMHLPVAFHHAHTAGNTHHGLTPAAAHSMNCVSPQGVSPLGTSCILSGATFGISVLSFF